MRELDGAKMVGLETLVSTMHGSRQWLWFRGPRLELSVSCWGRGEGNIKNTPPKI